ncbi:uncharacterized protein BXZ73DRAFT_110204 [Epithele typhae]|uniref:uncharacterized protein n=1 Tax=Epithele typhae TaxID=378194 RepID=UPI0020081C76|nr:uncharacterized protein BXZ73DRAFT_110204 [Epithele typhae]KAH9907648.1 hypothetical protein BXZ73DRAFT_110204 [Epithele typhae]
MYTSLTLRRWHSPSSTYVEHANVPPSLTPAILEELFRGCLFCPGRTTSSVPTTSASLQPIQIQSLLRVAVSKTIAESIANCLIVTDSPKVKIQLTCIHEHIFSLVSRQVTIPSMLIRIHEPRQENELPRCRVEEVNCQLVVPPARSTTPLPLDSIYNANRKLPLEDTSPTLFVGNAFGDAPAARSTPPPLVIVDPPAPRVRVWSCIVWEALAPCARCTRGDRGWLEYVEVALVPDLAPLRLQGEDNVMLNLPVPTLAPMPVAVI